MQPTLPEIVTARLVLRMTRTTDAPRIARLAGDYHVACMTARIPYPYGLAEAEHWLEATNAEGGAFAIDHEGELIGCCGTAVEDDTTAEIGYWIGRPWWGRGFATEAVEALVRHEFEIIRRRKLVAARFADNPASGRVLEKNGFRETGPSQNWCAARRCALPSVTYECRRPGFATRARRWLGERVS
jgi:RimJ/RimL family protein N-acetyltransferase